VTSSGEVVAADGWRSDVGDVLSGIDADVVDVTRIAGMVGAGVALNAAASSPSVLHAAVHVIAIRLTNIADHFIAFGRTTRHDGS
jgi:hypothetical protein